MKIGCSNCGKQLSGEVPDDTRLFGWIQCFECSDKGVAPPPEHVEPPKPWPRPLKPIGVTPQDWDLVALLYVRSNGGEARTDDIERIASWARKARTNNALVDSVLAGEMEISIDGDEIAFSLTEKGKAAAVAVDTT